MTLTEDASWDSSSSDAEPSESRLRIRDDSIMDVANGFSAIAPGQGASPAHNSSTKAVSPRDLLSLTVIAFLTGAAFRVGQHATGTALGAAFGGGDHALTWKTARITETPEPSCHVGHEDGERCLSTAYYMDSLEEPVFHGQTSAQTNMDSVQGNGDKTKAALETKQLQASDVPGGNHDTQSAHTKSRDSAEAQSENLYRTGFSARSVNNDSVNGLSFAIDQASHFLGHLKSGTDRLQTALAFLSEWEEWEALAVPPKMFWIRRHIFRSEEAKMVQDLKQIMSEIRKLIDPWLEELLTVIASGPWKVGVEGVSSTALQSSLPDLLLYFHVSKAVKAEISMFTETIATMNGLCASAEDTLHDLFSRISNLQNRALHSGDIEMVNHILTLTHSLSNLPLLLARSLFRNQGLHNSMNEFKEYDWLKKEVLKFLIEADREILKLSFLDESMNEDVRVQFLERVLQALTVKENVWMLSDHVSKEMLDKHLTFEMAVDRVETETHKLGQWITKLLLTFPRMDDLSSLSSAVANLASIAKVVGGKYSRIKAIVKSLHHDVTVQFSDRLQSFVQTVPAFDSESSLPSEHQPFVQELLLLKKASREIGSWSRDIDKTIDAMLEKKASESNNAGRFLFTLSSTLASVQGHDQQYAQQLLGDHSSFQGAVNAAYNAATARQGIDYVIKRMSLSSQESEELKEMFLSFQVRYRALIDDGVSALSQGTESEFFKTLARSARVVSNDYTLSFPVQVTQLSAIIFAYWTIDSAKGFAEFLKDMQDPTQYLKVPHAPQVVAVWSSLNTRSLQLDHHNLENHLVELKTGEGKSVVLGVTSTILALFGCEVYCVSYSAYLRHRDLSDFKDMFQLFDVEYLVRYSTLDGLFEATLNDKGDIRRLSNDVILRNTQGKVSAESSNPPGKSTKVLLFDEVDVFFKEDFYGNVYMPGATWTGGPARALLQFVWTNRFRLNKEQLLRSSEYINCLSNFRPEMEPVLESEASKMLAHAKQLDVGIGGGSSYTVVDGRIAYKHHDGITFSSYYGYLTAFAYIKEHESGSVAADTLEHYLGIRFRCGVVSWAELPVSFDVILGVTGTLEALGEPQWKTLHDKYGIQKSSFMPSVYGENQLRFREDNPEDMILSRSQDEHFVDLRQEIDRRRKPLNIGRGVLRAVMVFFEDSKTLMDFYTSDAINSIREETRTVTEEIAPEEKASAFLKATEQGAVTLLIRDYGRGTDFKCFDNVMLDAGGVHVIQAFYASDVAEEIQIKGRAARQGTQGSYSMVLNLEQLEQDLGVTETEFDMMKRKGEYGTYLNQKRADLLETKQEDLAGSVEQAEQSHYRTLAYYEALVRGKNPDGVRDFLLELNTGERSSAFVGNNVKETFAGNRKKVQVGPSHSNISHENAEASPSKLQPKL